MSVQQSGVNERLAALTEAGTSVWLDQIRRNLIESGSSSGSCSEDSLRGVTSNPAIFEKAILGSDDYDDEIKQARRGGPVGEGDLRADRGQGRAAGGRRAAPGLGRARAATTASSRSRSRPTSRTTPTRTLAEARDFWKRVDRPNVMIKIPGTDAGLPAIEEAIADGININVTLLFSVEAYERVAEAYIRGLERRLEAGESIDVRSVASFFVSRVDTRWTSGSSSRATASSRARPRSRTRARRT